MFYHFSLIFINIYHSATLYQELILFHLYVVTLEVKSISQLVIFLLTLYKQKWWKKCIFISYCTFEQLDHDRHKRHAHNQNILINSEMDVIASQCILTYLNSSLVSAWSMHLSPSTLSPVLQSYKRGPNASKKKCASKNKYENSSQIGICVNSVLQKLDTHWNVNTQ